MKFAQFPSCCVLTPACFVDQMDYMSRVNSHFTVVDRPSYRSTTRDSSVSVRRWPRLSIAVFLLLNSFVEFKPLDCLRNQSNRLSLTMTRTVSSKPLEITRPGIRAYLPISSVELKSNWVSIPQFALAVTCQNSSVIPTPLKVWQQLNFFNCHQLYL